VEGIYLRLGPNSPKKLSKSPRPGAATATAPVCGALMSGNALSKLSRFDHTGANDGLRRNLPVHCGFGEGRLTTHLRRTRGGRRITQMGVEPVDLSTRSRRRGLAGAGWAAPLRVQKQAFF
jgi:hypothetical protein